MLSHSFLTTMKNRRSWIYSETQDVSILISEKYFQIHIWYKFNNTNIVKFKKKKKSTSYKNTEFHF